MGGGVSSSTSPADKPQESPGSSSMTRKSRNSRHSVDSLHSFFSTCQEVVSRNATITMPPLILHMFNISSKSNLNSSTKANPAPHLVGTELATKDYDMDIKLTCSAIMNIATKSREAIAGRNERIHQLFYDIVKMANKAEQFVDRSVLKEVVDTIQSLEKMNLYTEGEFTEQTRALVSTIEDKTSINGPPTFVRQMSLNSINISRGSIHKTFHAMTSAIPTTTNDIKNGKLLESCDDYGLGYGLDDSNAFFDDSENGQQEVFPTMSMMDEFSDSQLHINTPSFRGLANQPMFVASQLPMA